MEQKGVIGGCTPASPIDVKNFLDILGGLKEIEGYIIMDTCSLAIFEGKVEYGNIPIPQHIRKALSDGDVIKIVVLKNNPVEIIKPKEG